MFIPIDDANTVYGRLVSVELFSALAGNINNSIKGMPIGTIIPILVGLPGVPTPNPDIWQLCDGSEIIHPKSPLRSVGPTQRFTPNYLDLGRYTKNYATIGGVGNYGGANIKVLSHTHGGATGTFDPPSDADRGEDRWTTKSHRHGIFSSLGSYDFNPMHIKVLHYLKIN